MRLKLGPRPDLAGEMLRDVERLGMIGETANTLIGYLLMASRGWPTRCTSRAQQALDGFNPYIFGFGSTSWLTRLRGFDSPSGNLSVASC